MASKRRCGKCKNYFPKEEMIERGPQAFCTGPCEEKVSPPKESKPSTEPSAELKEMIRERDAFACRFCGTKNNLHVHHIVYRGEASDEGVNLPLNLVTLCNQCHAIVHSDKKRFQPALLALVEYVEETRDKSMRIAKFLKRAVNNDSN